MAGQQHRGGADRTGEYGGDDGALEHERELTRPGKETGTHGVPTETAASPSRSNAEQAEQQQERDLATGEENPG